MVSTHTSPHANNRTYLDGMWSFGKTVTAYCTAISLAWCSFFKSMKTIWIQWISIHKITWTVKWNGKLLVCTTNEGNILGLRKNYKKTKTIGRQWNWNFFHIPSSPHNFFLLYSQNRRTWLKFIQWVENIYLQECIPVGCVPPARNRMGRGSP